MGQPVQISTASVPTDLCATNIQTLWPILVGLLAAELSGDVATINVGSDTPAPDDQDKYWFRDNADGTPDRIYRFVDGAWVAKHSVAPGIITMYLGTEASIETLDGGEAGAITDRTKPMWQKVSAFDARFPIGVGTLPSTTAVAVTGTGGEEKHTLLQEELPNVEIPTQSKRRTNVQDGGDATVYVPDTVTGSFAVDNPLRTEALNGDADTDTVAHNNLPPYIGVFFIVKTARTYYRL